ncbi:MAG: hypothetical protein ABI204_14165 [Ginsengibacter sp.]
MKINKFNILIFVLLLLVSCSKTKSTPPDGNVPVGVGNGPDTTKNNNIVCAIATISQVNSSKGAEYSLTATYNGNYDVTRIVIYDSVNKVKNFEAAFNYINNDSVRIDQYQYLILDEKGRVIRFVTKSDLVTPQNSDNYIFEYKYNTKGYLIIKNLYINGATIPNFRTDYSYTNNQLTNCLMTAVSSGNLKVLEAALVYDGSRSIKNWIYTFPDTMEGYMYLTVLNFGNRPVNPLKQVTTKIYNPLTGILIDNWTTSYDNYVIDTNGYVLSGESTGDLQQGIASFYGKTNFYYLCH